MLYACRDSGIFSVDLGITAPTFEALDPEDIEEIKSKLKFAGKKLIVKLHSEVAS